MPSVERISVYGSTLPSLIIFGIGFYIGVQCGGLRGVLVAWLVLLPLRCTANLLSTCFLTRLPVSEYLKNHVGSLVAALTMVVPVLIAAEITQDWSATDRLILCTFLGAATYMLISFIFFRKPLLEVLTLIKLPGKATS